MNLAETIYQKSLTLPPEKAQVVIDFIDFIKTRPNVVEEQTPEIKAQPKAQPSFSERWRGKFSPLEYTSETLAEDPRLAFLAEKYQCYSQ